MGTHRPGRARTLVAAAVLVLFGANAARAADLSGRIELRGGEGADASAAVVWFEPDRDAPRPAPITTEITTKERRFLPQVIAVPVGSTVQFPNQDRILHNVFSVSPGNRFDLGRYGRGDGRSYTFKRKGLARIFCNVHRTMAAFVVVIDTPHLARPDAEGRFELKGVTGPGTLHVFHPRAEAWTSRVEAAGAAAVSVVLDATLPPVPPHLDKTGRPYRDGDEPYR
jgi:plastocyanin